MRDSSCRCSSGRHSIFCLLPPEMLRTIARNGTPEQRETALNTLASDQTMRARRMVTALQNELAPRAALPTMDAVAPHVRRSIYDAKHGTTLPGTLVRAEGKPVSKDVAVNEAYDGLGHTFDFYLTNYGRNSIDNAGMPLDASVHYDRNYDNAFWDGQQMIFGDGDGQLFNRFTASLDVIGHELTHGVTAHERNLRYLGQAGALNESVSDVFGSLVKQFALKQTADKADWLIGAGLLAKGVKGRALRDMANPGTAYDDPVLGKDPQPADMAHYVVTSQDNGGVHTNSGIPNRAFYLVAKSLGGFAWERAGRIWYETIRDPRLKSTATFSDFAIRTILNASSLYGPTSPERAAAIDAWRTVGVPIPAQKLFGAPPMRTAPPALPPAVTLPPGAGLPAAALPGRKKSKK